MKLFDNGKLYVLFFRSCKEVINNKCWEFQVSAMFWLMPEVSFIISLVGYPHINIELFGLFRLQVEYTTETHHAGFEFNIKILCLDIEYKYYDIRHWHHNNDKWEEYDENKA